MAETLGQAVLELRTDDSAFTAGVNRAEAAATGLGKTLDVASGSSVALADRMRSSVAPIEGVTRATGAQRQGMMQLTQQLGDMSTMFALGMRPQQIFASQIGQVTGAVQLMAGESSKFASFLGGPWGVAVMLAVQVLGPLAAGLLSVGDAAEKSKGQVEGLRQALADLKSKPMETLGKLNLDVELAQTRLRQAEARPVAIGSGEAGRASAAAANDQRDRAIADARLALQGARSAFAVAEAVAKNIAVSAPAKGGRAAASGSSGARGGSSATATPGDAAFERDLTTAIQQELQAQLALATTAGERLDIQKALLENDRAGRIAEIEASKTLTEAQKAIRTAYVNRLYGEPGKVGPNGEVIAEGRPGLLAQRANREFEAEQVRLANDMLGRQAETAQAWAQVAPSMRERARLEAEALRLQQQIQTNLLEQQIATGQIADADKARAELRSQQAAGRQGLAERNAGPLAQYLAGLDANRADTGTRIEALMVQELDFVHRSIAGSISDRLGVEDPFLRGLIDMFVEDVFIRPFAEALQKQQGAGGGGGGLFSSLFSSLLGGGGASPQASLAGDVAATIGDPQFAGLFAGGGKIPTGSWGIVGEAGAEAVRAGAGGIEVMPNSALRSAGGGGFGGGGTPIIFDMRGAVMTEDLLRQANAQAAEIMTSGLRSYDAQIGGRVKENFARRGA